MPDEDVPGEILLPKFTADLKSAVKTARTGKDPFGLLEGLSFIQAL